jgi:hypothetical protein
VASLLLLDASGAFDNVSHARLLHNLRKRRIDERTVKWIASFLANRTTVISFDSFKSDVYRTATDIPQGSPLSPILYLCDDYGSAGLCSMQHLRFLKITTGYSLRSFCVNWQLPRYEKVPGLVIRPERGGRGVGRRRNYWRMRSEGMHELFSKLGFPKRYI